MTNQLLHLEHVEDYLFTNNYSQACDVIGSMADFLTGTMQRNTIVSTKYDGAPAIVFGVNDGRFFVGTKSVFNKRIQKIAYNEEDISVFYGDKQELFQKLLCAQDSLREAYIQRDIPTGVFQADIMWTPEMRVEGDRTVDFTPNTITYRANKETGVGHTVLNTSLGLVVHTEYYGSSLEDCRAVPYISKGEFRSTAGVFFIDPFVTCSDYKLDELQYKTILDSLLFCETTHQAVDKTIYLDHEKTLKMFINFCIRIGEGQPEVSMYESFLQKRDEIRLAEDVVKRRQDFVAIFMVHRHLTYAKGLILSALKDTSPFFTEVNGKPCADEGLVVTYHGIPCKFVDRHEFSKNNFANQRFAKV